MSLNMVVFSLLLLFAMLVLAEPSECPFKTGNVKCAKRCLQERILLDKSCPKGRVCCMKKQSKNPEDPKLDDESRRENLSTESSSEISKESNQRKKNEGGSENNYTIGSGSMNGTDVDENAAKVVKTSKWYPTSAGTTKPSDIMSKDTANNSKGTSNLQEPSESTQNSRTVSYDAWSTLSEYLHKSVEANRTRHRAPRNLFDCGDAEDRLRCRLSCPERRRVKDRSCPFKRICCRGKPSSIYYPLRQAPFYQDTSSAVHSDDHGFNYLINRYNDSDPIRVINIDEANDVTHQPPSSPTLSNNSEDNNILPEIQLRKSVVYCKKYQELTVEYLHAMPLLPNLQPFTLPMDNCLPRFMPLIVGGNNVSKGEFPHMAAVGYHKSDYIEYLCGGTLISEKFVLTAAHCAETKWGPPVLVMLGSVDLYAEDSIEIGVERTIAHPDYKPPSYYHDIALIELAKEAVFSQYLRPACLALPGTEAQEPGSVALATGWGKTGFARASTMNLMKVPLKIIENKKCEKYYSTEIRQATLEEGINDKLICATGHESEYHDTCQGDSGGPLQAYLPGHNCMLEVIAVTSFGKTCGMAIPGVYTKIEPYIDWIESVVWP